MKLSKAAQSITVIGLAEYSEYPYGVLLYTVGGYAGRFDLVSGNVISDGGVDAISKWQINIGEEGLFSWDGKTWINDRLTGVAIEGGKLSFIGETGAICPMLKATKEE